MAALSPDGQAALAICQKLLDSLMVLGPEGKAQFVSALAPGGQACHARPTQHPSGPPRIITYEKNEEEFPNRIPWDSKDKLEEGIDDGEGGRQVVVLVDHDIAMVWTPFWFKRNGSLTHVGTNCFTLAKHLTDSSGTNGEWKVVGMTDTGRPPSEEEKKRLQ
ncbi:hypothetical protein BR93DRAFT_927119 [Coniochaeta sp. PMI_546]|nr:hypothetical protein BR93DRAFT_927119 [Coniochaeta sp. PMI_546]